MKFQLIQGGTVDVSGYCRYDLRYRWYKLSATPVSPSGQCGRCRGLVVMNRRNPSPRTQRAALGHIHMILHTVAFRKGLKKLRRF